mmetsp:Transcript_34850/g.48507  ORF Transcript_34850/g.48507 Transcript_34850/m.48507 type:complete len:307 (+) Transcript_34850:143-1063(+)
MGACSSNEEVEIDRNVEKHLKRDAESQRNMHRLLLLGAGESGKSTIYKQSVDIYGKGYSTHARMQYSSIIHANVIRSMRTLIFESEKRANLSDFKETNYDAKVFCISPDLQEATNAVLNARRDENAMYVLTPDLALDVDRLWHDKGVRKVYEERAKFQLFDSADYFFDRVKELAMEGYVPSFEHMLRCRVQTTGISEHEFSIDNNIFRIVDVGGQRSERKKWIRCFEGVTCVVFVAAISTYDQVLFEDSETNRLHEALNIFEEVSNAEWFTKTSMILFLNKVYLNTTFFLISHLVKKNILSVGSLR